MLKSAVVERDPLGDPVRREIGECGDSTDTPGLTTPGLGTARLYPSLSEEMAPAQQGWGRLRELTVHFVNSWGVGS